MIRTKCAKLEALSLYCMLFFHPGFQGLEQHSGMLIKKKKVFISLFILSISVTVGGSQQNYSIMYFSRLVNFNLLDSQQIAVKIWNKLKRLKTISEVMDMHIC